MCLWYCGTALHIECTLAIDLRTIERVGAGLQLLTVCDHWPLTNAGISLAKRPTIAAADPLVCVLRQNGFDYRTPVHRPH